MKQLLLIIFGITFLCASAHSQIFDSLSTHPYFKCASVDTFSRYSGLKREYPKYKAQNYFFVSYIVLRKNTPLERKYAGVTSTTGYANEAQLNYTLSQQNKVKYDDIIVREIVRICKTDYESIFKIN